MHYRLFITLRRDNLEEQTSGKAREHALEWITNMGLYIQDGVFEGGWVDRFIIGGRWSGILSEAKMDASYFDTMERIVMPSSRLGYRDDEIKANAEKFQKEWERLGGTGKSPYLRDEFRQIGYADDAMVVDAALYHKIIHRYEGMSESPDFTFTDRDGDDVNSGFIGRKWLVVVDIVEKHGMEWNRPLSVSK